MTSNTIPIRASPYLAKKWSIPLPSVLFEAPSVSASNSAWLRGIVNLSKTVKLVGMPRAAVSSPDEALRESVEKAARDALGAHLYEESFPPGRQLPLADVVSFAVPSG